MPNFISEDQIEQAILQRLQFFKKVTLFDDWANLLLGKDEHRKTRQCVRTGARPRGAWCEVGGIGAFKERWRLANIVSEVGETPTPP